MAKNRNKKTKNKSNQKKDGIVPIDVSMEAVGDAPQRQWKGGSCDESTGGRREEEREDGVREGGNYDKRGKMEGKRESGSTKGGCGEGDRLQ
ncbi:hypothetical protein BHM03_00060399 [Ensete ventricosum]|uniref:Uncharacterized protein n=1 Tax=Ensete ventricosum TaxID=4639 RepID=A0A445MMT0_ENSVE|nr:hypothetical protein BHM03_00060399 [Ensete ventricosum]